MPVSLRWLAVLALFPLLAVAQQSGADIRHGSTALRNGVWYLTAEIEYRLSRRALDALQNGVPLSFELEVDLVRERRLLPNASVASLKQDYELSWQPLARSYLVKNLNSGNQQTHGTLYGALNDLGRIVELPLIDAALLGPGTYVVGLQARLDQKKLPGPLRLLSFWDDGLSLESDWHEWRLGN